MRFASLGSGSRGNATLVQAGDTLVMVDCGFSVRETERRLERLGVSPADLDALLVTHEHSDHCSGIAALSRKYELPVYLTRGTHASGRCDGAAITRYFHSGEVLELDAIRVAPIAVPHDAREPCQFVLESDGRRLGILTDLGSITSAVVDHYGDCHGLLLECNHDEEMLRQGPYPPPLKRRVGGDWGHLNNRQSADLLEQVSHVGLRELVVAHVSEQNNHRECVVEALAPVHGDPDTLTWADQTLGFDWIDLG